MLYLVVSLDDDSDRKRIEPMVGKDRLEARDYIFITRVILEANGNGAATGSSCRTGLAGNFNLFTSRMSGNRGTGA